MASPFVFYHHDYRHLYPYFPPTFAPPPPPTFFFSHPFDYHQAPPSPSPPPHFHQTPTQGKPSFIKFKWPSRFPKPDLSKIPEYLKEFFGFETDDEPDEFGEEENCSSSSSSSDSSCKSKYEETEWNNNEDDDEKDKDNKYPPYPRDYDCKEGDKLCR